ncbi:MAG: winged helix DNA-binding domain-containing protein [Rhodanobacter sp.]|jgi:uncharacterized protein YcaQ|nr:winged helix DNA-binding domain-containing protein [Rhodanobacter sp.]
MTRACVNAVAPRRIGAQQARHLHLAAQGLLTRPRRRARKSDVLAAIERMRVLQIDTIHVVARSPYLVLFSRLGAYAPHWLDELLAQGAIFEAWAHEACFLSYADFALHRSRDLSGRADRWWAQHAQRMREEHGAAMEDLLAHIRENGPVKAAQFARDDGVKGGGWWGWKKEKRWLEALFAQGELMIVRRENFHRVYDIGERVLAAAKARGAAAHDLDARLHADAAQRAFTLGAVRALGIAQARWINDYFRMGPRLKDRDLDTLVEAGELVRVDVEGWKAPGYVHAEHRDLLASAAANRLRATHCTLLSPFDPVVWDRERAATMFGFDYRIECYTPAPKRRYGYYVLPVLYRGRLVGRLDAKAHRAEGLFEVKALFLESGVEPTSAFADVMADVLLECAHWHGTPQVHVNRTDPQRFRRELQESLRRRGG